MEIHESLFSPGNMLNEQIARQIFGILPENGPIIAIMGKSGTCWPSNHEEFSKLNLTESFLTELCAKIDDGAEPVVTQADNCSIIATQLATEHTDCGYVIIALPQYSPESTLININLIEIILIQINLIARLIEKNNRFYELQRKHYTYGQSKVVSN